MKKMIAATIFTLLPALSHAADNARFVDLAQCMAYATVKGGLDGKKPVPQEYAVALSVLGDEFMFEAQALGLDDNQAHTFVVNELMRQNRIKTEKGMEPLTQELGQTCKTLSQSMIKALSQ